MNYYHHNYQNYTDKSAAQVFFHQKDCGYKNYIQDIKNREIEFLRNQKCTSKLVEPIFTNGNQEYIRRKNEDELKNQYQQTNGRKAEEDSGKSKSPVVSGKMSPSNGLSEGEDSKHPRPLRKYGGQTALSDDEEQYLVDGLLACANWGFPQQTRDIKIIVRTFLEKKACSSYCNKRDIIEEYFANIKTTLDLVPASHIINYNETNFTDNPGNVKVTVRRGVKHADGIMDTSKTSISVMVAAAADGTLLPPYILYKSKYVYPGWMEEGVAGSQYNSNPSGWFDSEIFSDWFRKIVLPYIHRFPKKHTQGVTNR
ncbi:hypothetical protein NQ315_013677 [Exocentrus adspersus]|uniref:DDE-1 domain-containing protein n=1 Tax=Exocentrus adspersus TaxID=1586481 RepID=A0AAV8W3S4_9CUCU|nr:hypothetical protein NQ315_013677 [Exocentrus adspersus]